MSVSLRVIPSSLDPSVNFVRDLGPGQALESRHVLRDPHRLTCYLSCQTACAAGCRFCHLTATDQRTARDATLEEVLEQARRVLDHHAVRPEAATTREVSFSFMARGEPLLSDDVVFRWSLLHARLSDLASEHGYLPRFKVSTIMPRRFLRRHRPLYVVFPEGARARLYWSAYSADPAFLRRWMPAALPPEEAAPCLQRYVSLGGEVTVHHAVIARTPRVPGNDAPEELDRLLTVLDRNGLLGSVRFNLVRFNPPPGSPCGEAPREALDARLARLRGVLGPDRVQEVTRVGPDAYASCGMFPVADA